MFAESMQDGFSGCHYYLKFDKTYWVLVIVTEIR
jgi:hypothetical protein